MTRNYVLLVHTYVRVLVFICWRYTYVVNIYNSNIL